MIHQQDYWENFYKNQSKFQESSFARFCLPFLKGQTIELGSGNGRDLDFFLANGVSATGVDSAFSSTYIMKMGIEEYIGTFKSPEYVYTRFVWHSISDELQEEILQWTKEYLFIEARTTEDAFKNKVHGDHDRNFVDIIRLIALLKVNGFQILHFEEGTGFSKYKDEDPHLLRLIAKK